MCGGCQTWKQLGDSTVEEAEQEERCKRGMETDQRERLSFAQHSTAVLSPCPGTATSHCLSTYSTSRFRMVLPAARTSATLETIGS